MVDPRHRSFPDVPDGRPMPSMGYEILEASAGLLDWDGAAELARNLAASGDLIPRDEITPQMAAEVLLGDDINLARMAEAMHDGPLGAGDYWFSIVTDKGQFCVDSIRAALTAIKESNDD